MLHARYEGSSDRGGALKPPPMGLGSYWALVDTKKTRFDRCFKKSIFGSFRVWLPLARAPRLTRLIFFEEVSTTFESELFSTAYPSHPVRLVRLDRPPSYSSRERYELVERESRQRINLLIYPLNMTVERS